MYYTENVDSSAVQETWSVLLLTVAVFFHFLLSIFSDPIAFDQSNNSRIQFHRLYLDNYNQLPSVPNYHCLLASSSSEVSKNAYTFQPKTIPLQQASEEEEQKVASDSEVADVSEDTEEKESETPEESEPEIRVNMEGIQEQISKGIRDIFGGKTQEEKEEFTEESDDMINEAGITKENEIPEEIIKSDASQEEPENVPQLEAEPEKPGEAPVAVPVESVQEEKKEPDFFRLFLYKSFVSIASNGSYQIIL